MTYQIFAVEPTNDVTDVADYIFVRNYCDAMRLPFVKGWDHWAVYLRKGQNLILQAKFTTYQEAEEFVRDLSTRTVH